MKVVNYIVKEDWNSGILGLVPEGVRMADNYIPCTDGNLLAHDLLEHQNGFAAIGTIRDELEAIGGIGFVRGPNGVIRKNSWHPVDEAMYQEVLNLFEYVEDDDYHPLKTGLTQRTWKEQDSSIDWIIERLLEEKEWPQMLVQNIERCLNRGFIKARRRFKEGGWACNLFFDMTDRVDEALKQFGLYEGMRFQLRWKLRGCEFKALEDDYYE